MFSFKRRLLNDSKLKLKFFSFFLLHEFILFAHLLLLRTRSKFSLSFPIISNRKKLLLVVTRYALSLFAGGDDKWKHIFHPISKVLQKFQIQLFLPIFFFLITESSMGASCTTEIFFFFVFDSFPQFDILKTFSIAYFNHNFSLMYQSSWRREQLPATAFAGSVPLSASIIWIYML